MCGGSDGDLCVADRCYCSARRSTKSYRCSASKPDSINSDARAASSGTITRADCNCSNQSRYRLKAIRCRSGGVGCSTYSHSEMTGSLICIPAAVAVGRTKNGSVTRGSARSRRGFRKCDCTICSNRGRSWITQRQGSQSCRLFTLVNPILQPATGRCKADVASMPE